MSDVNANIGVHIDTSSALTQLKALQKQLALFHGSVSRGSAAAASAQAGLQQNLLNSINATGKFSASMGVVRSSTESFTHALEKNKLSMGQYFKYAGASTKTFGRLFKSEFDTIGRVAEERVRKMQTQYIKMGRDSSGAIRAMSITPTTLNMKDLATQTAIAAQRQALFNQLVKQGSTNLLNFGKNTQWAGRQLMVGFTVPLMYFGAAASKVFMDLEKQTLKFKRVYGDMFTTPEDTEKAIEGIRQLADEYTKYGVEVTKTVEMAAQAAAMGKVGADLRAQVESATRLSVLGAVEQEDALLTTISLTNAFGLAAEDLASKIDFLNAVENQTVLSIEDLTIAVPKAGPVVRQLGGDVEDLAFFMTAMKEGGINASEGANALKSGLASLINPAEKSAKFLSSLGINLKGIVEANQGDLKGIVIGFSQALDTLDPLNRARAIEQLFGKFQFARLSTLFQNVTKDGSQAARTLQLAGASVEELAILSERELKAVEDSVGVNFKEAVEQLKVSIAPIGKEFLKAVTPIIKFVGGLLEKFNGLSDGTKQFIVVATALVGIVGPILLMTFGLLANGAANIIKLFLAMRQGFMRLGGNSKILAEQTTYLNSEQLEAATVAASLNQVHTKLTQQFQLEANAVRVLRQAYIEATAAATKFALANPNMMMPGARVPRGGAPRKYAKGVTMVPGSGTGDTVPAMLTPGEGVVPADVMKDERAQALVGALISGKLFGYNGGSTNAGGKSQFTHVGGVQKVDIDDLLKDPNLSETDVRRINVFKGLLAAEGSSLQADSYHGLGFAFDGKLNDRMGKAGISYSEFEREWAKQGYGKWQDAGILEMDAVAFDDELSAKVRSLAGDGNVTDDLVQRAFKDLSPEMKKTTAYKAALKKFSTRTQYQVKKGLPTTVDGLESTFKKAIAAGYLPAAEGIFILDGDEPGPDGKPKSSNAESYLPKNKHVIVTRTNSDGKRVISSVWPIDKVGEGHISLNRIGSGGKRFDIRPTQTRPSEQQAIIDEASKNFKKSALKKEAAVDLGRKIGKNPGRSFGVDGVGGFFEKPDGTRVFAKPVLNETAALAEIRATQIARDVHGLDTPIQKMIVMKDPITGAKIIGLESPMEERFTPKMMKGDFSREDYFKQTVAAALRGDADLAPGNLSGRRLTDVGPAGVFSAASGNTTYAESMRSMEDQARIFLQEAASYDEDGKAIPRKTAFRNSTLDMIKDMSSDEYARMMTAEIDEALPKLRKLVADPAFGLNDADRPVYEAMIRRLEAGRNVDWKELHAAHTGIVIQKGEALQDKKTKKITPAKGTKKPANVKADSGDVKDNILIPKPSKDKTIVKTGKPKKSTASKKSPAPRIIRPGRSSAPYANPYDGMSDDQKRIEKSIRRQSQKIQREKMAALRLEQKELRAQEALKKKIAKSRGQAYYNRFTGSGMTPDQIAVAKSIQRNRGTQGQVSPYVNSGMTKDEIAATKSQRRQAEVLQKDKAYAVRQEQKQVAKTVAEEKKVEKQKLKNEEYKKSAEYKQQKMMRMQGVGMAAGMASSAAYMTGNTGIGNALMGISVVSMLAPMISKANAGFVLLAVALAAFAYSIKKSSDDVKKIAKSQSQYVDAVSGTTKKMQQIGVLTNTVGASEIMTKRRESSGFENFSENYDRAGQQFGTSFMSSEVGKSIATGFGDSLAKGDRSTTIRQFALQLATYVSDGVLTGVQAGDVARQLSMEFKDMSLYPQIISKLTELIGPDGTDLLKDPLKIRVALITEQQAQTSATEKGINPEGVKSPGNVMEGEGQVAAAAATAASYTQALELAQAQVDATNLQYSKDLQILQNKKKIAKTEADRVAAQKEIDVLTTKNKKDNTALGDEMRKILKGQSDAYAQTSSEALGYRGITLRNDVRNAFLASNKQQVIDRYAGTPEEAAATALLANTKALSSSYLEVKINAIAGAGGNPALLSAMTTMFKGDEKSLNKEIDIAVKTRAIGDTLAIVGSLGMIDDPVLQKELFVKINAVKDKEKFGDILSILTKLAEMDGKDFDVNVFLKEKGFSKLDKLSTKLREVQNIPSPITKVAQLETAGLTDNEMAGITSRWEYFMSLPETIRKTAITTYITAMDVITPEQIDAEIEKTIGKSRGRSAARLKEYYGSVEGRMAIRNRLAFQATEPQFDPEAKGPKVPKDTTLNDEDTTESRDTTLDDLLKRLKLTRDASINVEKGLSELRRVYKDAEGDIKKFAGVNQQLRDTYSADSDFIDFIGGMDNATQKGYLNIAKLKKGIVELTPDGTKALELYKEAQIGAFGDASNKAILQLQKQRSGFVALKSAGAESSDALEMLSDSNFAISLSAAKTAKEVKELIKQFKAQREEAEKTLIATDPLEYFNNQRSLMNQKFDVDERQIRAQFEPAIEAVQKQIDGQNEIIRLKQYEMETNKEINVARIDSINKEIDLLERSLTLGIDKQLSNLSDESARYSEDLAIINKTAEDVNKKYDLQEKALTKVSQINQDIIDQQKSQISLADALTSGDISAAAQAAQSMREQAAATASNTALQNLALAREAAVKGIRSSSGMTEDQIAERQYQIDRSIYGLNVQRQRVEDQIAVKQEQIYQINLKREAASVAIKDAESEIYRLTNATNTGLIPLQAKLQESLDKVTGQRKEWDAAKLAIDVATVNTEEFRKKVDAAEVLVKSINTLWKDIKDKDLTLTLKKIEESVSSFDPDKAAEQRAKEKAAEEAKAAAAAIAAANAAKAGTPPPASAQTADPNSARAKVDAYLKEKAEKEAAAKKAAADKASAEAARAKKISEYRSSNLWARSMSDSVIAGVLGLSEGGMVPKYFSVGGMAKGTDTVPAMLTPGEFIVNAKSAKAAGPLLAAINSPSFNGFRSPELSASGSRSGAQNNTSLYNYSIGINVNQANASSDDIARSVINQIKYIDSQRIRGQK